MSSSSPPLSGDGDGISDKITRSILDAHGAPDSWERRGSPGSPVFCESLVRVFLFFPRFLEQVAGSHVSLVGWRPSLVGWRPSLVETQKDMVFDATCYMLLHLPGQVGGFGLCLSHSAARRCTSVAASSGKGDGGPCDWLGCRFQRSKGLIV